MFTKQNYCTEVKFSISNNRALDKNSLAMTLPLCKACIAIKTNNLDLHQRVPQKSRSYNENYVTCVHFLHLCVFKLGHRSSTFGLKVRLELTPSWLLGLQLANYRSWNFSASIIT